MTSPSWFEPPPKHEPGCLKGCLFLVAFIVIGFVVLLGSVYYWGTRSHSAVARGILWLTKIHAIAEKPATIPRGRRCARGRIRVGSIEPANEISMLQYL